MNITELRARLRRQVGNPSATALADSVLDRLLNAAYKDIADKFKFHRVRKICRFDTVSGQDKYSLPTDTGIVRKVRDVTNERKLEKYDLNDVVQRRRLDTEGKPLYYTHLRDWLQLFPVVDGVYVIEVHYQATVLDLTDVNATPIIPIGWHEGISLLARHKYYDEQGDIGKAIYTLNVWKDWLKDKPIEVFEELKDLDKGVRIPTLEPRRPYVSFDEE